MTDYIIIGVIAVIAVVGIFATVKHFKGESSCCGGGSYKPKKKKLKNVRVQKTFRVEGMHCEHCKRRVEEVVNDISGVAGSVNLKKNELTVSYETDVDDTLFKTKLEQLGYTVSEQ